MKPGYLADVVVLSGDIEATSPDNIALLSPVLTICDGRVTFEVLLAHFGELHPALRDRLDDLPELARHILARLAAANRVPVPELGPAALAALRRYDYPGNVRELENILERGLALADDGAITPEALNLVPVSQADTGHPADVDDGLQAMLDRVETRAIRDALDRTGGNKTAAARLLGITFRSLRYRLERLGLES